VWRPLLAPGDRHDHEREGDHHEEGNGVSTRLQLAHREVLFRKGCVKRLTSLGAIIHRIVD
jgi:hypothetical protein